ncbi:tubulin-tyrosine ligase, putative [Trypanosoma equiperdum]|uniref:Tubulin--tyrosine ligase-like protein 5 n=1 Tax=Trypanosoma equiperdum TaxID=5694 RepID=A0A1G4IB44_TRYEQ|nr:tubulin-tyrosine ligase, putative [Trypanosoma equiperdum]
MTDGVTLHGETDVTVQRQQQERNKRIGGGAFHPTTPSVYRFESRDDCTVWETTSAPHTQKRSAAADEYVTVCLSPFHGRRPTILFKPFDRPCDDDLLGADKHIYIEPSPLPRLQSDATEERSQEEGVFIKCQRTEQIARTGPYGTLSFTMPAPAVRFSAVMCALERAGFVEDTSLLSKSWLLKWCKRPVRSDFSKLRLFQRINHFPGTWRLGKKDELHRHLVAARVRWNAQIASDSGGYGERHRSSTNSNGDCCEGGNSEHMNFFPEAWVLPDEQEELNRVLCAKEERGNVFIAKPTTAACGRGIQLLVAGEPSHSSLMRRLNGVHNNSDSTQRGRGENNTPNFQCSNGADIRRSSNRMIVQRYVSDPLLVEGYKFDLRLYVVVTSYVPLRAYLYTEGLVRFATSPYPNDPAGVRAEAVMGERTLTAHLTNFTINKKSEDFFSPAGVHTNDADVEDTASVNSASKWTLSALESHFNKHGLDWDGTMKQIHDILVKVLLSVQPHVKAEMDSIASGGSGSRVRDSCFEVYGVDVLLRRPPPSKVIPIPVLMEVNIMPSLSTHYSLLDQCVKGNFVADMLTLVGLTAGSSPVSAGGTRCKGNGDGNMSPSEIYGHAFLDSLNDVTEREACVRAEEEQLRSRNFIRICPTSESYNRYCALFSEPEGVGNRCRSLDEVLSAWEQARRDNPPSWAS